MRAFHMLAALGMSLLFTQCSLKLTSRISPFSISIVEASSTCRDQKSIFHVVVTNISNEQQRLCLGGSWGDQALSFKLTDQAGKQWVARRIRQAYTANVFGYRELRPREKVFEGCEDDVVPWEGIPHPKNKPITVTMQAVLHYHLDKEFLRRRVWAGTVVSKPKKFTFYPQ